MGKTKKSTYIICAVCVLLSLLLMGASFFLYNVLRGDVQEESDRIEDYRQWALPEKYSQLLVFPEAIPASATDIQYYYRYESGYTRPMCQIYLRCQLDSQDYASEVARLSGLTYESAAAGTNTVLYDSTSFRLPAYVTIEGYDFCYEYALVDDTEQSIVYVYAMNTIEQDIKFSTSFLPNYFMEDFTDMSVTGLDRYTMYERYQDE